MTTDTAGSSPEPPHSEQVAFVVDGARCVGELWKPDVEGPLPVVLLASGLGGVYAMGLAAFARRFAEHGYAAMAFDYRHFGVSDGLPRQLIDITKQRRDYVGAIEYLRTRDDINPQQIILWGTSFSGGHVLTIAAERSDIAAVIAQCPFTDGPASSFTLGPVSSLRVSASAIADVVASALGRPPVYVEAAGPAGSAALMTRPDALPGVQRLIDSAAPLTPDTRVAARIALHIGLDRPGKKLSHITAPTLIQVCHPDTVAPDKATHRHIRKVANPHIRSETIQAGHFDIYSGPAFETAISQQLSFLASHL